MSQILSHDRSIDNSMAPGRSSGRGNAPVNLEPLAPTSGELEYVEEFGYQGVVDNICTFLTPDKKSANKRRSLYVIAPSSAGRRSLIRTVECTMKRRRIGREFFWFEEITDYTSLLQQVLSIPGNDQDLLPKKTLIKFWIDFVERMEKRPVLVFEIVGNLKVKKVQPLIASNCDVIYIIDRASSSSTRTAVTHTQGGPTEANTGRVPVYGPSGPWDDLPSVSQAIERQIAHNGLLEDFNVRLDIQPPTVAQCMMVIRRELGRQMPESHVQKVKSHLDNIQKTLKGQLFAPLVLVIAVVVAQVLKRMLDSRPDNPDMATRQRALSDLTRVFPQGAQRHIYPGTQGIFTGDAVAGTTSSAPSSMSSHPLPSTMKPGNVASAVRALGPSIAIDTEENDHNKSAKFSQMEFQKLLGFFDSGAFLDESSGRDRHEMELSRQFYRLTLEVGSSSELDIERIILDRLALLGHFMCTIGQLAEFLNLGLRSIVDVRSAVDTLQGKRFLTTVTEYKSDAQFISFTPLMRHSHLRYLMDENQEQIASGASITKYDVLLLTCLRRFVKLLREDMVTVQRTLFSESPYFAQLGMQECEKDTTRGASEKGLLTLVYNWCSMQVDKLAKSGSPHAYLYEMAGLYGDLVITMCEYFNRTRNLSEVLVRDAIANAFVVLEVPVIDDDPAIQRELAARFMHRQGRLSLEHAELLGKLPQASNTDARRITLEAALWLVSHQDVSGNLPPDEALANEFIRLRTLRLLSKTFFNLGDHHQALTYGRLALNGLLAFRTTCGQYQPLASEVALEMSSVYRTLGQILHVTNPGSPEAQSSFLAAINVLHEHTRMFSSDRDSLSILNHLCRIHMDWGVVLIELLQMDKALEHLRATEQLIPALKLTNPLLWKAKQSNVISIILHRISIATSGGLDTDPSPFSDPAREELYQAGFTKINFLSSAPGIIKDKSLSVLEAKFQSIIIIARLLECCRGRPEQRNKVPDILEALDRAIGELRSSTMYNGHELSICFHAKSVGFALIAMEHARDVGNLTHDNVLMPLHDAATMVTCSLNREWIEFVGGDWEEFALIDPSADRYMKGISDVLQRYDDPDVSETALMDGKLASFHHMAVSLHLRGLIHYLHALSRASERMATKEAIFAVCDKAVENFVIVEDICKHLEKVLFSQAAANGVATGDGDKMDTSGDAVPGTTSNGDCSDSSNPNNAATVTCLFPAQSFKSESGPANPFFVSGVRKASESMRDAVSQFREQLEQTFPRQQPGKLLNSFLSLRRKILFRFMLFSGEW